MSPITHLTKAAPYAKHRPAMKTIALMTAAALALTLSACKNEPKVIDSTSPDPMASQLANAPAVELPPVMVGSVSFRCKDNSLVNVDFFKGDTQANLLFPKSDSPIILKAANEGDPLTGEGYTMTGDQHKITLSTPDKGEITCTH